MNNLIFIPFAALAVLLYGLTVLTYHKYNSYVQYHNYLCNAWDSMYKRHFEVNKELKHTINYSDYYDFDDNITVWSIAARNNVKTTDLIKFVKHSFKEGLSEVKRKELV